MLSVTSPTTPEICIASKQQNRQKQLSQSHDNLNSDGNSNIHEFFADPTTKQHQLLNGLSYLGCSKMDDPTSESN